VINNFKLNIVNTSITILLLYLILLFNKEYSCYCGNRKD